MPYKLTKGTLSKLRQTADEVRELQAGGFNLEGECDADGNVTSTAVSLPPPKPAINPDKKALVDAALAAGVIDPKTEKIATESALKAWGDDRLVEATAKAVEAKNASASGQGA